MRKHMLDQWLDNLDSLLTTYANVARLGGELLEQTQRSRNDALHLLFELGNRQLGQFWSWYSPDPLNTINLSARHAPGVVLAVGLDDDVLATLRPIIAHRDQRLIIVEPCKEHRPAWANFAAEHLRCDISSYRACDKLIKGLQENIGPVEILIKQSTSAACHDTRAKGILDNELDCLYNLAHHLVPGMIERGYGRIIILKPAQGTDQQPQIRHASIYGFVRSLARELSHSGITAQCIPAARLSPDIVNRDSIPDPLDEYLPDGLDMSPGQILTA